MSSNELPTEEVIISLKPVEAVAMEQHLPPAGPSLKQRLTERFAMPGSLVICRHRTIIGTWKACNAPFHVYNLGMGGLNFWNHGKSPKAGAKMKLTLLVPNLNPIDVVAVVVWSKAMPRPDGSDAADQYTHITGVKFVDYDAGAWAVLRKIHQIATAHSQSAPQPAAAQSHNLPAKSPASAPRQAAAPGIAAIRK
ncbi:MAG: hypothetical protein ACLQVA_11550 [Candidatus Brocadiia bacterium]